MLAWDRLVMPLALRASALTERVGFYEHCRYRSAEPLEGLYHKTDRLLLHLGSALRKKGISSWQHTPSLHKRITCSLRLYRIDGSAETAAK